MQVEDDAESKAQIEIEKIENLFKLHRTKLDLLQGEISNCARYIKISSYLAEIKSQRSQVGHENFWGWLQQHCLLRVIIIDSCKLMNHTNEYLISTLKEILPGDVYKKLIKNSLLRDGLKKLKKTIDPHIEFRNKRFAHLENCDVKGALLHLPTLLLCLANLYNSVDYIRHYLMCPEWIVLQQWDAIKHKSIEESPVACPFQNYFEVDPAMIDLREIFMYLPRVSID